MSEIREARSSGTAFGIEPQGDGTFRIYGLGPDPVGRVTPDDLERMLKWIKEKDGANVARLRGMLDEAAKGR
jgi:hypothetical protein